MITFELGGGRAGEQPDGWSRGMPPDWAKLALLDGPTAEVRQVYTDGSFLAWRIASTAAAPTKPAPRKRATKAAQPESKPSAVSSQATLKLPGRSLIEKDTVLTVTGIRGKVRFVRYCVNNESGKDWVDVIHIATGKSRYIDPSKIKTVHRSMK